MLLNYKYEFFPTEEQKNKLEQWINICRQQYNSAVLDKSNIYKSTGENYTRNQMQKQQTQDKKKFSFLKKLPSQPLQEVFFRVERSFKNFFRGDAKYPKVKNFRDYHSITFTQFGYGYQRSNGKRRFVRRACRMINNQLFITKLGKLNINLHRPLDGKVKQVVVKRQSNKWFAIFCVERHTNSTPTVKPNSVIGIDVGIHKYLVTSNGEEVKNPKYLRKMEKKLKQAKRKLSKMQRHSNNYKKQLQIVRNYHTKVSNQRKDFLHKLSYRLSNQHDTICVEDLNIRNMLEDKKLAKSISDAGWSSFITYLSYKLDRTGGTLIKVCPKYTTQDCSKCKNRVKKSLSIRTHICTKCGTILDRDHNAAINIKNVGLASL